jgi:hypothetical protein
VVVCPPKGMLVVDLSGVDFRRFLRGQFHIQLVQHHLVFCIWFSVSLHHEAPAVQRVLSKNS